MIPSMRKRLLVGAAILFVACGEETQVDTHTGTGGALGTGGSAATGAVSGSSGTQSGGASGTVGTAGGDAAGGVSSGTSGSGGTTTDATTCSTSSGAISTTAVNVPADLYMMLDRSGSMNKPQALPPPVQGDCNVGDTVVSRWCYMLNALDGFFTAPSSTGVGVALQFFPNGTCGVGSTACCSSGTCCEGAADSIPAVPLGLLPGNRVALDSALNAQVPSGDKSPDEPALRGIVAYTTSIQSPGREVAGVLLSDGNPRGCATATNTLSGIISAHLAATGIKTFIIGMTGADFATLEAWAIAGGALAHTDYCAAGVSSCHYYNVGDGDPAAFTAALQQIQQATVACALAMPTASDGSPLAPSSLVVRYFAGGTGSGEAVPHVASAADCGAGWYFDDNTAPREIVFCPTTCSTIGGDAAAQLEIDGCT